VVKAIHSLIFFGLLASLLVFLVRAAQGRSDRIAALAGAFVATEGVIFCGNGRRCPLAGLAESLGDEHGAITDLYLPPAIAEHIFELTAPILTLAVVLHARNLLRALRGSRGVGDDDDGAS
jgi:hypothetical protein